MSNHHIVLGTGPLGRATAEALVTRGLAVTLVNRAGTMADQPKGAQLTKADILDVSTMTQLLQGAASVYFCAQPPYHLWPEFFPQLQRAAMAAAQRAGARFVVAENLYGYGPVDGPLDEDLPLRPTTRKRRVRAEMHDELRAAERGGLQIAVARGSDFYGPHVEGSAVGERAFRAVLGGSKVELLGDPSAPHAYTFIKDFGETLAVLGTDDRALGEVWHVPNAPALSSRAFFERAFAIVGRTPKMRRVGKLELALVGLLVKPVMESIEMLYEFEHPFVVDHSKYAAAFGNHSTPIESALSQTLGWFEAHGAKREHS